MELIEGHVVAGRFRLMRLLGKGGMGDVWLAQHVSLDIPCAVKFIHAESAEKAEVRERFEREAKAAAQLRSPNVVQILDYGVSDNVPYIAMEYLEGEALSDRLRRCGKLHPLETFRIIAQVGKALQKAHQAGIVHRDLKPENIFLVPDADGEVAKVLDFGVAKQTHTVDSSTRTGALLGTPYYMSPEQAQGTKAVDARADLWSIAVVVFRCLTGELPFKSQALGDLLIKIVTHPIPMPSHIAPVPEGFDQWWERAAQRDPNYRFQNAKDFVQALGMALGTTSPTLGTTPFPGPLPAATAHIPQYQPGNTLGNATPSGAGALPFQSGAQPLGDSGQYRQGYGGPMQPGMLADSGASASVAGLAAAAPPPSSSKLIALIGVLVAIVVVGGAGAFLLLRGKPLGKSDGATPAAASEVVASAEPPVPSAAPATSAAPVTSDGVASAAPSESAAVAPDASAGAPAASAASSTRATPSAGIAAHTPPPASGKATSSARPIATSLDVPPRPPASAGWTPGF